MALSSDVRSPAPIGTNTRFFFPGESSGEQARVSAHAAAPQFIK
jgi:hypothetical protein